MTIATCQLCKLSSGVMVRMPTRGLHWKVNYHRAQAVQRALPVGWVMTTQNRIYCPVCYRRVSAGQW